MIERLGREQHSGIGPLQCRNDIAFDHCALSGRGIDGHDHDAVQRLAEVPGLGVDSAQQIIAEVGATAATFPSAKHLASWMGACPGTEESAGKNYSHRCPKGNRQMRRVLNQAANAAALANAGGGEVVRQADLSPERLAQILQAAMNEPERLENQAKAAKSVGKPDAARLLADLAEAIATGKSVHEFKEGTRP